MRQNCGIHSFFVFGSYLKINFFGNLAQDFTMLVEGIKHQQNNNKNSPCSIFGPNSMTLYYCPLRESCGFYSQHFRPFLTQCLSPKLSPAELASKASFVTSQRKLWFPQNWASWLWPWWQGFPHLHKSFSHVERMKLVHISDIPQEGTSPSVTPGWCVSFFVFNCVSVTYLLIFYGTRWGWG